MDGFAGAFGLAGRERGKVLAVRRWETEENLRQRGGGEPAAQRDRRSR